MLEELEDACDQPSACTTPVERLAAARVGLALWSVGDGSADCRIACGLGPMVSALSARALCFRTAERNGPGSGAAFLTP